MARSRPLARKGPQIRRRDRPAGGGVMPPAPPPMGLGLSGEPAPAYGSPFGLAQVAQSLPTGTPGINPAAGASPDGAGKPSQGGPAWSDLLLGAGIGLLTGDNWGEGAGRGLLYAKQFGDQRADRDRQARLDQMQTERFEFDKAAAQRELDAANKTDAGYQMFLGRINDNDPTNDIPGLTKEHGMFMAGLPAAEGYQFAQQFAFPQPDKLPTSIQEYQFAQNDPGFQAYQENLKKAGASNTNVNVNTPKSILAGDNKLLEIGAEGAAQAQEIMPLFDIAENAAKNFSQSGPLGGAALFVERGKNYLGLPNNASAGEVLQGMQTRLGTLLRVPGSGATSNMEMSLYMQGVPGLLNSQQGNVALAQIGKKLVQRRLANFQNLQAYVAQNGTSVGYMPDDTPALTPEETQMLMGAQNAAPAQPEAAPPAAGPTTEMPTISTPEEAAKLPKGTKFRDPNGVIRVVP